MAAKGIKALELCVKLLGSQQKVAEACGVRQQTISERLKVGGLVPAEWCIPLERATDGEVTRQQLRPDIYPNDDRPPPKPQSAGAAAE